MDIITKPTITCPNCGHANEEEMPIDTCQLFYECENCNSILNHKEGDCFVNC